MMTENKGTAPNEMAPAQVNSHVKESNTDRKIIQQSSQQRSRIKGKKRVTAKGKPMKLPARKDLAGHKQKQTYRKQLCP